MGKEKGYRPDQVPASPLERMRSPLGYGRRVRLGDGSFERRAAEVQGILSGPLLGRFLGRDYTGSVLNTPAKIDAFTKEVAATESRWRQLVTGTTPGVSSFLRAVARRSDPRG